MQVQRISPLLLMLGKDWLLITLPSDRPKQAMEKESMFIVLI